MAEIKATEIKLSPYPPPQKLYKRLKLHFGTDFEDGIIFVYGDTIHTKYKMTQDLYDHEATHVRQQEKIGKEKWWDMYLAVPIFRLEQELEAYRAQYKTIKKEVKNREKVFKNLHRIAKDLSGPMYGNLLTYQEAMKKIKE